MATVRGSHKRAGEEVALHQWGNDWFTVDTPDGQSEVFSPSSLQLSADERKAWRARPAGMERHYALRADGTFRRIRR